MFLFPLFLPFHSCSSFCSVYLFHLIYYLFSFLPFLGRRHKLTHEGWRVVKPQHNQKSLTYDLYKVRMCPLSVGGLINKLFHKFRGL